MRHPASATLMILALGLAGPARAIVDPVVSFQEIATSLAPLYTRAIDPTTAQWGVDKFVLNATEFAWTDFHIALQVWNGSSWADSGEADGISFGQPTPFADWLNHVTVDINGVIVPGWHVVRTNVPKDELDFFFDNFVIQPGQTLSLHFDMADTVGDSTWRLKQTPTIPEPQSYGLFLLGLGGLALLGQRRRRS